MFKKILFVMFLVVLYQGLFLVYGYQTIGQKTLDHMDQLGNKSNLVALEARTSLDNFLYIAGWSAIFVFSLVIFNKEIGMMYKKVLMWMTMLLLVSLNSGCWKPFEPIKLEVIQTNEEAFLLPFTEDVDKQTSSNTEDEFNDRFYLIIHNKNEMIDCVVAGEDLNHFRKALKQVEEDLE